MINFTNFPKKKKSYGGANGNKLCVIINDDIKKLIDSVECINENHKTFLKLIISERYKALFC